MIRGGGAMALNGQSTKRRKKAGVVVAVKDTRDPREFRKVGRLSPAIAKKIGVKAGDIMIDSHAITHLMKNHKAQLEELGVSAEMFVRMVVATFNMVYSGHEDRLLLVCSDGLTHYNTVVIAIIRNKGFWEVVTACPRRIDFFKNKIPIYIKKR